MSLNTTKTLVIAYLVDAFELLNSLNKKLQGRESDMITHRDHIRAFIEKVILWKGSWTQGISRHSTNLVKF